MAVKTLPFNPKVVTDVSSNEWDAIVVVAKEPNDIPKSLQFLIPPLLKQLAIDDAVKNQVSVIELEVEGVAAKRLVFSPTGPIGRDQDDVRRFFDAANKGLDRAVTAGAAKPVLVVPDSYTGMYSEVVMVTWLGAFYSLYTPIEIREGVPKKYPKVQSLGFWVVERESGEAILSKAVGIELGNIAARDIGGSDPERMAAPRVETYVEELLAASGIEIEVMKGHDNFKREFPLLSAVDRCANQVERHQGRVIKLVYTPEDTVTKTLFLVGKGITYDTGGADVKAGGVMAGMHRDKCGAAAVAGFFKTLSVLKPKGIKVVGQMCMVRNSIGQESYVADEIIISRANVRIRVGNTDAEGRMAMADPLCRAKEWALDAVNPHIVTIATLTGHVIRAYGPAYSAVLDNGPAKAKNFALDLQKAGDEVGDMLEVSTLRREDYDFVVGRSEYEDVLQCNNEPSSSTARGHQFPAAFLIRASGLDKHGRDSDRPLPYSHIDIAGSSGPWPGKPSGRPVPALTKYLL
jgi:leucyl aminopeptidase